MDAVAGKLLEHGIPGIFILVLLYECWTLWRANIALTNQIARLQEAFAAQLAKVQEERIADVKSQTTAFVNNTNALERSTTTLAQLQTSFTSVVAELQARRRGT